MHERQAQLLQRWVVDLQIPRPVVGRPIQKGERIAGDPGVEVRIVGKCRREGGRPHALPVSARVIGNVLLRQAARMQKRHVRILRHHLVVAHQNGRLVQPSIENGVGKSPCLHALVSIDTTVELRWVPRLVIAHMVFASTHNVVSSLVAQAQVVLEHIIGSTGVVAPHASAIVFLPGHQAGARRGANGRRTDCVGEPDAAPGELPQMRRAHRNIGVHLDPLRPLLIRLDKKYVRPFVRHARSPLRDNMAQIVQQGQCRFSRVFPFEM